MPTAFIFRNIRIVIHSFDHGPAHIHAISPKGEAKIELASMECYYSRGYTERGLKRIVNFAKQEEQKLWEVWYEIHSKNKK